MGIVVRHLPELTEQEAMQIFKKHFEFEEAKLDEKRLGTVEEEGPELPKDDDTYDVFEVYKPKGSNLKGFLIQRTILKGNEVLERVATNVRLVQEKDKTSFELSFYEPSKAKFVWELFNAIFTWLGRKQEYETTEYDELYTSLENRVASFIKKAPEFKDPNPKPGWLESKLASFVEKLADRIPDEGSGPNK